MNTRILVTVVATCFVASISFAQMNQGYGPPQTQPQQIPQANTGAGQKTTTTTTKKTMPVGVKGYLDDQIAHSNDKKFHVAMNGKDLALTPGTIHSPQKNMTAVDMKGTDGKMYEIDFVTSNGQVTGARVGKVNGKAP